MKRYLLLSFALLNRWFHKRNIIIISERKVKHIPISGGLQFVLIAGFTVGVAWASYSTGSYMAARVALKEQGQALRSVTNAHIENSFVAFKPAKATENVDVGPYKRVKPPVVSSAAEALSTLDNAKLVARIALLENKLIQLKTTNEAIVKRVYNKTEDHLTKLETVVEKTGLNVKDLQRYYKINYHKKHQSTHAKLNAGGPYINDPSIILPDHAEDMFTSLDNLAVMSYIVEKLPLGSPISDYKKHSRYGHRIDPFNGRVAFHSGLDLSGTKNAKVTSSGDGKVIFAGRKGAYGNCVDVDHGFGIVTRYGHLKQIKVRKNDRVSQGDVIGIQGSTGRSTGAHLHYEVRYHNKTINPDKFLKAGAYVSQE